MEVKKRLSQKVLADIQYVEQSQEMQRRSNQKLFIDENVYGR